MEPKFRKMSYVSGTELTTNDWKEFNKETADVDFKKLIEYVNCFTEVDRWGDLKNRIDELDLKYFCRIELDDYFDESVHHLLFGFDMNSGQIQDITWVYVAENTDSDDVMEEGPAVFYLFIEDKKDVELYVIDSSVGCIFDKPCLVSTESFDKSKCPDDCGG